MRQLWLQRSSWPFTRVASAGLLGLLHAYPSTAMEVACECRFVDPSMKAYGTRAACSAVMTRGKKECNVSFGGTGADPEVLKEIGRDPVAYEREVHRVVVDYFTLVSDKREALTDARYVEKVLPMFMRGAYARRGIENVKLLDYAVTSIVSKNSSDIAAVISGKKPGPIKFEDSGYTLVVFRGAVTVESANFRLTTVYLPN